LAEPGQSSYTTELEGLRAPLGVILYLIRRDNLDIYDIPIARITREYLDYLNMMEEMQIELAGEFFVLAATLMRIKAQMLLRRDEEVEDDPRDGLVRSLLEYKKMVEAAKELRDMEEERRSVFTRPVPDAEKAFREDPEIDLSLYHLMKAFREVIIQFEAAEVREIELETYTIEEKIEIIEGALGSKDQVLFVDLFEGAGSRMELIVTLMALLELVKHGHVKSKQDSSFGAIWIYRAENFGRPLGSVSDWESEPPDVAEVKAPVSDREEDEPAEAGAPKEDETDAPVEEAHPVLNEQPVGENDDERTAG
jgi:segregation and condensation protein A